MPRKGSASDVLADFARGVAAENGTVLDERDLEAAAGGRKRSAPSASFNIDNAPRTTCGEASG